MKSRRTDNLLTNSRLKTARACMRRHHYEYELGYRSRFDGEDADFGTLVHAGLEAWWNALKAGITGEPRLELAIQRMRATKGVDAFALVQAEVMFVGYECKYGPGADDYEVLSVEIRFEAAHVNPDTGAESRTWRIGGKLDVLVRQCSTGFVLLVEHKTSGEDITPGSFYWRHLRLDSQVSTYFDGAAALGHQLDGILYDVLGKFKLRPSQVAKLDEHGNKIVLDAKGERVRTAQGKWRQTGDTQQGFTLQTRDELPEEYRIRLMQALLDEPDRYLVRGDVVRLEAELQDARADAWALGKTIRENQRLGRHPRNPDACFRFNRPCPFFDVCCGGASLEDTNRFENLADVHPELAGADVPNLPALSKEETPHDSSSRSPADSNPSEAEFAHDAGERRGREAEAAEANLSLRP